MININLEIRGIDEALDDALSITDTPTMSQVNKIAGEYLRDYICDWYDKKGRDHWLNPALPTHGPGRVSTKWHARLSTEWTMIATDHTGALLVYPDTDDSLALKIYGGTITPKRAQALTIPLIPEAHGRSAHNYASEFGKLFTLRQSLLNIRNQGTGSNHRTGYLFEAIEGGGIRAVYALKKSVTHQPWPESIPSNEDMSAAYANKLIDYFTDFFEQS